jgi:hypothetical protein
VEICSVSIARERERLLKLKSEVRESHFEIVILQAERELRNVLLEREQSRKAVENSLASVHEEISSLESFIVREMRCMCDEKKIKLSAA